MLEARLIQVQELYVKRRATATDAVQDRKEESQTKLTKRKVMKIVGSAKYIADATLSWN